MKSLFYVTLLYTSLAVGCHFTDAVKASQTPDPTTGLTPAEEILKNTPRVISNPLDIPAWVTLITTVGGLLGVSFYGASTNKTLLQKIHDTLSGPDEDPATKSPATP